MDFSALPGEIKDIIVSFLRDREKRLLRSTSTEWFNTINYSHFTIYFAKSSMLPDIIETFQRYSKPIGLCFQKSRELSPSYVTLTVLSNLTRLEIDPNRFASPEFFGLTPNYISRFASLTNLQHFTFATYRNIELAKHLPNLTYLATRVLQPRERPEYINYLRNVTNLQTLDIVKLPFGKWENEDLFDLLGNPGALNSLEIIAAPVEWQNTESVSKVSNLTKLYIKTKQFAFPFSKLPKLESLNICGADQLDDFSTSTNLTHLDLTAPTATHNYEQLMHLKNLRSLALNVNIDEEDQYSFLGALTNLESLTLQDNLTECNFLQFIQSSKLTRLSLRSKILMLNYMTHLTNLEVIEGRWFNEPIITPLTNVTRLVMEYITEAQESFPNIKHLEVNNDTNQKNRFVFKKNQFVTSLQHLETLVVKSSTSPEMHHWLLGSLTNLTELNATYGCRYIFDFNILTSLTTLKVLKLLPKENERVTICREIPRVLPALTNLESLSTFGVPNDALLDAICALSKLTWLSLEDREAAHIDEQKFSNLTNLQCVKLAGSNKSQPSHKLSDLPYLYDFCRPRS